ncbi:hypothetical protein [Flavobacterium sp. 245]|uniref:hypothetical protein n=1 Tax=Flavobacterium sp. 245 TaxID=2512115 RepID=UPI00105C5892|nr:hypothetical protein [Flavobacterium sp. 245]TDP02201.1 hypothetical protein EV145_103182 [Flavobacterium sp. 245]
MDLEIVYSYKEYQQKYLDFLNGFCSEYEESEPIDFINIEIEKYKIVSRIINFSAEVAFSPFFKLSPSIDLKVFSVSQEMYDFIFAIENTNYYYKMYKDIIESTNEYASAQEIERKIIQIRMIFPKIISFLETKKNELIQLETEKIKIEKLSVKQIALKLVYEGVVVSKENANEIIQKYGYTSGHNLYQEYNKVWSSKKRITDPNETLKVLQNKIDLFESVAEIVSPELKEKVEDEIKLLKNYVPKY